VKTSNFSLNAVPKTAGPSRIVPSVIHLASVHNEVGDDDEVRRRRTMWCKKTTCMLQPE